jgi:anti-anti-sigma factor
MRTQRASEIGWDLQPALEIWVEEHSDLVLVSVAGDLSGEVAGQLRKVLSTLVGTVGRRLLIDVAQVGFVDSIGIGILVGARLRARRCHGELRIANPILSVRRAFSLCGLDDILSDHALASLST